MAPSLQSLVTVVALPDPLPTQLPISVLHSPTAINSRIGVMVTIFLVSLFAVSFPGLSKQIPFLRIPRIVFFIGKHFGTGVILSTAFCHLLQDAFGSLNEPLVKQYYRGIGNWTGLIILTSLLSIFLVEYISTSYVTHLQAESSAPPSRLPSRPPSPSRADTISPSLPLSQPDPPPNATDRTPLIPHPKTVSLSSPSSLANAHLGYMAILSRVLPWVPRHNEYCVRARGKQDVVVLVSPAADYHFHRTGEAIEEGVEGQTAGGKGVGGGVGRRRQIVGILVLQLGIMIHSLVIGLTLAITSGADFASLVTAVTFHQLFEGLSLGIRIAALPAPPSPPHSRVSSSSHSPSHSSLPLDTHAPTPKSDNVSSKQRSVLKPTLSILFALTTPLGMGIGLGVFTRGGGGDSEDAQMCLTQGLMSAISAGMLIYAATVEMLAGDFVFGDLADSHHGHGHGDGAAAHLLHAHREGLGEGGGEEEGEGGEERREREEGGVWRQVVAVVSLLAGVGAMGLVGLGE